MKMKVIYKPEAATEREWIVDRANPDWSVSYPVETETGWGWLEFVSRLDGMSSIAWRALLWALRKEDGEPRLRPEWVQVAWSELDLRLQCPRCEEWAVPQGHECEVPGPPEATEPVADEPEKDGETAPEA